MIFTVEWLRMKILWKQGDHFVKLLEEHKLSKDVRDIDFRDIQEVELKGFGDHLYKVDWQRGKKYC